MAQSADTDQQTGADSQVPVFTTVDGRRLIPVVPPEAAVSAEESTDTVVDKLAGNFSESVVNEVRKYGKPEWEQTESSTLDPIEDIEDMYTYDFKLPPHVHDKYVEAAAGDIVDLEQLKGPVDTELLAKIEQRRKLTEGRHADDVKWLKHKAYYRGINKVRAAKKQLEQIAAEDAEDAAVASTAVASPSSSLNPQPSQPHPALYSADEVLAGISDPSEWDMSYTAASYQQHPEVLQQLRSSFAACLGLPYVSPQQQQEREQQLRQALAQQQEEQQQAAELAAAKEAFVKKYTPFHVRICGLEAQVAVNRRVEYLLRIK